ncbi:uncharacterized protein K452DRAFT_315144 [Aplosporella prunicola CBS 121167]|uniref:Nephrocystin 3-like N-terminal domain-containing protein n=1 Tax=Aplosporella prunicola CBS 121167 TaxID=1176127 RepID=A0A6A6BS77_9PEZI|nr:uncharacterized protein K452DRAFT_315144 [Aplosporella prunicola CBS 121167]KAF2146952.1 hypothetical protein K452DRAFT_315144 [Aplosporella prunicola CBS 121167]
MDLTSGVAGLVSFTIELAQLTYNYVSGVKDADRASTSVRDALNSLLETLLALESSVTGQFLPNLPSHQSDLLSQSHIDACKQRLLILLERLRAQLKLDGTLKKRHSLSWPFKKQETLQLVSELHDSRDTFQAMLAVDTRSIAIDTNQQINKIKNDQEFEKVLSWLLPKATSSLRFSKRREHCAKTENWIVEEPAVKAWTQSNSGSVLWCYGSPGSGKSVLM